MKLELRETVTVKRGKRRVRKHRMVVLGTARYALAAGRTTTLRVKLDRSGRHDLVVARNHRLAVEIVATVKGGKGATRHETIFSVVKKKS